jgi:hypothetical protein
MAELYEDFDCVVDIRNKILEWLGHIMKMDQVTKMFDSKPKGRRRMGRRSMRWLEDVERDRREGKVERLLQQAVSTAKWASVIKALRER